MVLPLLLPKPTPAVADVPLESLRLRDYALTLALRSPWFRGRLLRERLVMLVGDDPWVEGYRVLVAEAGGELHQVRGAEGLHRLAQRLTWGDMVILPPALTDQTWLLRRLNRARATVVCSPGSSLSRFARLLRCVGTLDPVCPVVPFAETAPTLEAVRSDFAVALTDTHLEAPRQPLAGKVVLVVGEPVLMPDYRLLVEIAGGTWSGKRPDIVLRAPTGGLAAFERMIQAMFFRSR